MWHIVKVRQAKRAGNQRGHQGTVHRHRGFSHPARFETLEERTALNAAPAAPAVAASLQPVAASGASAVNGATGSAPGTNPANFSPASTTGSIVAAEGNVLDNQQVAFNTPYWIPNDRVPLTSPPSDQLPASFNQEASTPHGIRNFNIGPDASTHFTSPGIPLTVGRPTNRSTGENRVVSGPLDDALRVDNLLGAGALVWRHEDAAAAERANEVPPGGYDEDVPFDGAPIADTSPAAKSVVERPGGTAQVEPVHLEAVAVDRMMADQNDADTARADAANCASGRRGHGGNGAGRRPRGSRLGRQRCPRDERADRAGPNGATDRRTASADGRAPLSERVRERPEEEQHRSSRAIAQPGSSLAATVRTGQLVKSSTYPRCRSLCGWLKSGQRYLDLSPPLTRHLGSDVLSNVPSSYRS
jgi:hypothetical protein